MTLKNIFSPVLTCFLIVVTVSLYSSVYQRPQIIQEIPTVTITPTVTQSATPTVTKAGKTPSPTPVVTKKPVIASCIVTINGNRYNVINLRRTHSGGDIFTCNTDMTSIFNQQHGSNYGLIARYRI